MDVLVAAINHATQVVKVRVMAHVSMHVKGVNIHALEDAKIPVKQHVNTLVNSI